MFGSVVLDAHARSAAAAPGQEQAPQGGGRVQDRLRGTAGRTTRVPALPSPPQSDSSCSNHKVNSFLKCIQI
jgi:hypothetical protein